MVISGRVLLVAGYSSGLLYVSYGCVYWLVNGEWLAYNVCFDLGWLCPTERYLGLNKILFWLSDNPLAILSILCASAIGAGHWLLYRAEHIAHEWVKWLAEAEAGNNVIKDAYERARL